MNPIQDEGDVIRLARSAWALSVITAWHELGLFAQLKNHGGPMRLEELPADLRALELTAPILAHVGLLEGGGGRWKLSKPARVMIDRNEMPTERNLSWLGDLSRIREVLRQGGPVKGQDGSSRISSGGVRSDDEEGNRRFMDMLRRRADTSADAVADWVAPKLEDRSHIIDVGGGHGRFAKAFVDRGHHVTLFDMDAIVALARERYGEALSYRVGDFHDDDFGSAYDAALLSNIVHGESDAANANMFRRLFVALRPGGWLVIKDMFIDEQGRDPESAVFFGLTMLFYTGAGRSWSLHQVTRWCDAAGFESPEVISMTGFSLVFARKPE